MTTQDEGGVWFCGVDTLSYSHFRDKSRRQGVEGSGLFLPQLLVFRSVVL